VLEGPLPLTVLEKQVDSYIERERREGEKKKSGE
jgi:hypothetical protein